MPVNLKPEGRVSFKVMFVVASRDVSVLLRSAGPEGGVEPFDTPETTGSVVNESGGLFIRKP